MNKPSTFNVGDHVRIASDYHDQTLQGRTGKIVSPADKEHPGEYVVKLASGCVQGKVCSIPGNYLQRA